MTDQEKNKTVKAKKPAASKTTAAKKPRAPKKEVVSAENEEVVQYAKQEEDKAPVVSLDIAAGKYIYATGRRKTAVANVRVFMDKGDHEVNKKPAKKYFSAANFEKAFEPFRIIGQVSQFKVYASVNGGGVNSQAEAVRHGIAQALASASEDVRKIMKKNGYLTRDDRKKERKKPGLKRARRSPQWAKR